MSLVAGIMFVIGNLSRFRDDTQETLLGYAWFFSVVQSIAFAFCMAYHVILAAFFKGRVSVVAALFYLLFAVEGFAFGLAIGIIQEVSKGM
jgi:hypothetical protein